MMLVRRRGGGRSGRSSDLVALRISMEEFHKPELALLDTSKLNRLKNTLAENGLRTACWVTLPRRVVL